MSLSLSYDASVLDCLVNRQLKPNNTSINQLSSRRRRRCSKWTTHNDRFLSIDRAVVVAFCAPLSFISPSYPLIPKHVHLIVYLIHLEAVPCRALFFPPDITLTLLSFSRLNSWVKNDVFIVCEYAKYFDWTCLAIRNEWIMGDRCHPMRNGGQAYC